MDIGSRIRDFITQEILYDDRAGTLTNSTPLLDGIMDSLALMQLVAFLEEEFDVEMDDADITAEHFRTVADIESLIRQKVAPRA